MFLNFSTQQNSIGRRNRCWKTALESLFTFTLPVFWTKQGAWHKGVQLMNGFHFPSTRTTNSVRLILGSQYSLCENCIKRARLLWGLKQVVGTNLIPLRTTFDTQTKRVPAWPVISQLWFPKRHFSANGPNGISLCLSEVQMKFDEIVASSPFLCPSRLRRSLARSRETRFTRPNRRACSLGRLHDQKWPRRPSRVVLSGGHVGLVGLVITSYFVFCCV